MSTAPATFPPSQLNRKKSSVADLRQSFENLTKASPQNVATKFSLSSQKRMPKQSSLEVKDIRTTMPQPTPSRTVSLAVSISDMIRSAAKSQASRRSPTSKKSGELASSTEVGGHPNYSYPQLEPVSLESEDTVGSQVPTKPNPSLLGAERPAVPTRKSSVPPSGPFHPFLRQQNSSVNRFQTDKKPAKTVARTETTNTSENQQNHDGPHKVKELTRIYEAPPVVFPDSDWDHLPNAARIQDAFDQRLATGVTNKPTPNKAKPALDAEDNTRPESPSRLRNKLRKKKHISPLKEKVSMFESLNRPVSRLGGKLSSRARSFETGAVLKRGGEEVTNSIKKLAGNGTRMWRRLSGSFEKEREKHTSAAAANDVPQAVGRKTSSFTVLLTDFQKPSREPTEAFLANFNHIIPPRGVRQNSTFLLEGTSSRIPIAIHSRHTQTSTITAPDSRETSDSSTSEVRDFAIDGFHERRVRSHTSHPVLPQLDFDTDGTPDMLGYFERNFDMNLISLSERSTTTSTFSMGGSTPNRSRFNTRSQYTSARTSARPPTNSAIPAPTIPSRHPGRALRSSNSDSASTFHRKSHASPVLSTHSARGDTTRTLPYRRRRKPALSSGAMSQQRVWDTRRSGATPRLEVVRSEEEMIYTAHPAARPVIPVRGGGRRTGIGVVGVGVGSGSTEHDAPSVPVVAGVQCRLAHPKPSRVLNLKRFVGFCRERSLALGQKL